MADRPLEELNGRTVLEVANTEYMDAVVANGCIGSVSTVPKGLTPASDVANLAILGYDPKVYYRGRAPLEASNIGVEIKDNEVAFRCNMVTVHDNIMIDYSADHISTKESALLIGYLNKKMGSESLKFYVGKSYRHLMIMETPSKEQAEAYCKIRCTPPHDIQGKNIVRFLPKGKNSAVVINLMNKSVPHLRGHDVNNVRIDLKENPANMIWLWGQGVKPNIPRFDALYGIKGAVISAVDLVNGLGKLIGFDVIDVPGVTGYYDTNYKGKAEYALRALEDKDFVFVHVEAPDEAGHNGDMRSKISAIENFDKLVVGTIWEAMKERKDFRIMILPDHATPLSIRSHTDEPVPFAVAGKDVGRDEAHVFTERAARASGFSMQNGSNLMRYLIRLEKSKK